VEKYKSIAVPVTRRDAIAKTKKARVASPSDDVDGESLTVEFRRQPQPTTTKPVHAYRVGERLLMARGSRDIARPAAWCQVTALVPHETGPLLYRVRSDAESFERIVDEVDLAPTR
jgi:hypothetical protein